jgi:hypothetical protein
MPPAAAQPKPDTVRPELFKLLDPAQIKPLMDAKNYTEVQNRVTQAEAFPDKTPYETYVLNRMKLSLATAKGNDQARSPRWKPSWPRASCRTPTRPVHPGPGRHVLQRQELPEGDRMVQALPGREPESDAATAPLVRSYYLSNDFANAMKLLRPQLEAAAKRPARRRRRKTCACTPRPPTASRTMPPTCTASSS